MIGKLKGVIDYICKDHIIIDVSGVGYIVFCNTNTIYNLKNGQEISLYIQTIVREDNISLFGFENLLEKEWFNKLTMVKGVGSKMAQNILGVFRPDDLIKVIILKDTEILTQAPGVGPKLAARMITELKTDNTIENSKNVDNLTKVDIINHYDLLGDAVSALSNLGYNRMQSLNIVKKILEENNNIRIEEIIKMALKELI